MTVDTGCACALACSTPTPTPTEPCSGSPCSGTCVICPPCTPGTVCPLGPCELGHCDGVSGSCGCVPGILTPTPTPTRTLPTISSCVGDCFGNDSTVTIDALITMVNIALGTAPSSACPGVEQWCTSGLGVTVDCIIVAVTNALDDCGISGLGGPCGGFVADPKECAPGLICQFPGVPDIPGTCVVGPTPTPQCSSVPCGGDCVICPTCPSGELCFGPVCRSGVCELNPFTGCQCVPVSTPTPSPTPVLDHGHTCCQCENNSCTDFAWVEVEPLCPGGCQTFQDAECEALCHPGPSTGSSTCVSLTPCTADADCDDGNGCTADHCTIDGCTHACVCE